MIKTFESGLGEDPGKIIVGGDGDLRVWDPKLSPHRETWTEMGGADHINHLFVWNFSSPGLMCKKIIELGERKDPTFEQASR